MNEILIYIFFFLIGTTVLNFVIAITARIKTGYKEFNKLVYYWFFLFFTYFAVATLKNNPTEIAFAYFFQSITSFMFVLMLYDSRGIRFNYKLYISAHIAGMLISTYLLLKSDAGFTISLLPVTITMCLPFFHPIWNTLVSHRHESNWIEKFLGYIFITGIVNHFNYALFRLDPSSSWWGWSVSIAQYQCLSIFLPMLINHRRAANEKKNIELAIFQLSNNRSDTDTNMEINELYRSLENVILQKEKLTQELQKSNTHLEEEREMNEMLIKTVSHDLANPLSVIKSYTEMIETGRIPKEDSIKTVEKIKANTVSALEMIKRIRSAILTRNQSSLIAPGNVTAIQILKSAIEVMEPAFKAKKVKINLIIDVPEDTLVFADEKTLKENIFANALSNALKFSFRSSEIFIKVLRTGKYIEVHFKDQGMGMSRPFIENKFLLPTEGTEGETGSGIGIIIMGYFLKKMEASYEIHSTGINKGTTVIIRLLQIN
jgi:signal transduction histidine kinase